MMLSTVEINELRDIAVAAGREIMLIYRAVDRGISAKADLSPVTEADRRANKVILKGLKRLTAELVVSEEDEAKSLVPPGDAPFWLVDPLDGTRDFVNHLDTFVVCIARVEQGYPSFGLIHWPVTGETWWAQKGKGAHGPKGERLFHRNPRTALICAGSRSMPSEKMQGIYDLFGVKEVQRYGSALKFCRFAEGAIDIYPRNGPTSEWDTAAGQIIVEEAGGQVVEISSGKRLKYGKPAFENRGGFVVSNAGLHLVSKLKAAGFFGKA
jgi:3'(2'), 5'-bisphosphate nucleotidase